MCREIFFCYRHSAFIVMIWTNMDMKKKEIHQLLSQFINGECSPLYWVCIKKYLKKCNLNQLYF